MFVKNPRAIVFEFFSGNGFKRIEILPNVQVRRLSEVPPLNSFGRPSHPRFRTFTGYPSHLRKMLHCVGDDLVADVQLFASSSEVIPSIPASISALAISQLFPCFEGIPPWSGRLSQT